MAIFSEGGWTSPDCPVGISCICLAILCTVLNSLVFLHNYHKNKSVARSLYLCLSATDLVTAWVILVPYSVMVLKKEALVCADIPQNPCESDRNDVETLSENVSLFDKVFSVISQLMVFAPNHLTASLAITRYIQIKYPLRPLKIKTVIISILLSIIWHPAVVTCYFLSSSRFVKMKTQFAVIGSEEMPRLFNFEITWQIFSTIVFIPTAVLQISSIVSSLLTIYELIKSYITPIGVTPPPRRLNTKSTVRILVTNIGSVMAVACYVIVLAGDYKLKEDGEKRSRFGLEDEIKFLLGIQLIPAIVSTLNPVTYIVFSQGCSLRLIRPG